MCPATYPISLALGYLFCRSLIFICPPLRPIPPLSINNYLINALVGSNCCVIVLSGARFLEFCSSFIAFENCRVILLLLYTTHTSNRERSHMSRLVPAFVFRQYRARLVFRSRVDSLPSNLGSILLLLYTTYTFNIGLNGASFASHCACLARIKWNFGTLS